MRLFPPPAPRLLTTYKENALGANRKKTFIRNVILKTSHFCKAPNSELSHGPPDTVDGQKRPTCALRATGIRAIIPLTRSYSKMKSNTIPTGLMHTLRACKWRGGHTYELSRKSILNSISVSPGTLCFLYMYIYK